MTTEELDRALRQLRLGGLADTLAVRAQQARADNLGPARFLEPCWSTMSWTAGGIV